MLSGLPGAFRLYFLYENGKSRAQDFLFGLQERDQSKLIRLIQFVETNGLPKNPEKYKKLTRHENLHELKSDQARLLFFTMGKEIVFTVGFKKDQWETPPEEIERAERLRREWLNQK
jgi:mRNA-degrading endonuclease RelE of RelBE toxin-antitoxin system